jgi:hypothetical protein
MSKHPLQPMGHDHERSPPTRRKVGEDRIFAAATVESAALSLRTAALPILHPACARVRAALSSSLRTPPSPRRPPGPGRDGPAAPGAAVAGLAHPTRPPHPVPARGARLPAPPPPRAFTVPFAVALRLLHPLHRPRLCW